MFLCKQLRRAREGPTAAAATKEDISLLRRSAGIYSLGRMLHQSRAVRCNLRLCGAQRYTRIYTIYRVPWV